MENRKKTRRRKKLKFKDKQIGRQINKGIRWT
jgi:hypothetical protein